MALLHFLLLILSVIPSFLLPHSPLAPVFVTVSTTSLCSAPPWRTWEGSGPCDRQESKVTINPVWVGQGAGGERDDGYALVSAGETTNLLSAHSSIPSTNSFTRLSICPSVCPPVRPSAHPSTCLFACLFVCPSTCLSIIYSPRLPSLYPPSSLPTHPPPLTCVTNESHSP